MFAWMRTIPALVVVMTLVVCAQSAALPSGAQLQKRMDTTTSHLPGPKLTFDEVHSGMFRPEPEARPLAGRTQTANFYGHTYFLNGKPVFVFRRGGSRIPKAELDTAMKTFGEFHIYNAETRQYTTIVPNSQIPGTTTQSAWHGNIDEYMQRVARTREGFGPNIAVVAHGIRADEARPKKVLFVTKQPSAPSWDKVWRAEPLPRDLPNVRDPTDYRNDVRAALNANRHVRFVSSDGTRSMALRAHPDGSIEQAFKNLVGEPAHFHP